MNPTTLRRVGICILAIVAVGACSRDQEATEAQHSEADHSDRSGSGHNDEHAESGEHVKEGTADPHGHEEGEDLARIDPATAKEHGVEISDAGPARIAEAVTLTGRLVINPRRISQVRARFSGPVRRVHKDVGDTVKQGEALAEVESNESMTVYEVRAPIAGVVLDRATNVGDVALDEPLFRIGDLSALQAELRAFSKDQSRIQRGADAIVLVREHDVPGKVINLVPELDSRTQALRVRIEMHPEVRLETTPGQFVTARILVGDGRDATVAIPLQAIQRLQGREVIFVPEAEGFVARDVTLGRRDNQRVEVVEGLAAGERYVSAGAYLLKAEIGKHGAGHEH